MKSVSASHHDTVAGNQRARLLAALVQSVDTQGYEATTVRDLLERAGLARGAFQRHFANLEECFLAAVDAIADVDAAVIAAAYGRPGGWETRLRAAFDAAIAQTVDHPAAARTCVVGVHVVGTPAALRRDDWALDRWVRLVRGAFVESPERAHLPTPIVRGIVGGVRRVVHTRLCRGAGAELPALADGLCRWALAYPTPPGTPLQPGPRRLSESTNGHGPDWPQTIHAALEAMLLQLAEHPAWARLVIVEALAADSTALDHLDESVERLRDLLREGTDHEQSAETQALVTEAISGAILSLCHTQIRRHGPERLPELLPVVTYLALTPFGGARKGFSTLTPA